MQGHYVIFKSFCGTLRMLQLYGTTGSVYPMVSLCRCLDMSFYVYGNDWIYKETQNFVFWMDNCNYMFYPYTVCYGVHYENT